MSEKKVWQDLPIGGVAFGSTALEIKTGLWRSMRPVLDVNKCISCMKCWLQCPDFSITTDDEAKVSGINLFYCKGCAVCEKVCPVGAIAMYPESEFNSENEQTGVIPGEVGSHVK